MTACSADGALMIHVSKQYPASSGEDGSAVGSNSFNVLGRVFSGTLHAGQHVRILGETYSSIDEEDSRVAQVGRLWIPEGRYKVEVGPCWPGYLRAIVHSSPFASPLSRL